MDTESDIALPWVIGLMSGTSLDGIDAALIRTDGERVGDFGPAITLEYDPDFRAKLAHATRGQGDMAAIEQELTVRHAHAVQQLLEHAQMTAKDCALIGFHGQTVRHQPELGITHQLGNGALLASATGIDVVCDFRKNDVAHGGQGAPLVPLFHAALCRDIAWPVAVVNIGGVANVTWVGNAQTLDLLAFDTGPGNALLNDFVLYAIGLDCDVDGKLAQAGKADDAVIAQWMSDPFFAKKPPKSLDRNAFSIEPIRNMSAEDGAATLTEFTARSIAQAQRWFAQPVQQWLVCGGGVHNLAIMQALRRHLGNVKSAQTLGWNVDALEAQAFAYLAMRSKRGLALSLPSTTGVSRAVTGGVFYPA